MAAQRILRAAVGTLIAFLSLTATTASAEADPKSLHAAWFEYDGAFSATGETTGECTANAALFQEGAAGALHVTAAGARLERYVTEWNVTVLAPDSETPVVVPHPLTQTMTLEPLQAGQGGVRWSEDGVARVFGAQWLHPGQATDVHPFHVEFESRDLRSGESTSKIDTGSYFVERDGVVWEYREGGVPGWNRLVEYDDGSATLRGDLTIFLQAAEVEWDGVTIQLPPTQDVTTVVDSPAVARYTVRHHHAFLRLEDARILWGDAPARIACADLDARMDGTLLAHGATGALDAEGRRTTFGPGELSLVGLFELTERPAPTQGRITGQAAGDFRAIGLDFETFYLPDERIPTWVAAAGTVAIGALAASVAWILYTRLEKPGLLGLEKRTIVYEALRATPWMTLPELQRATQIRRSTLRYQLGVLARHGVVRATPTTRGVRFAPLEPGTTLPAPDPVLRILEPRLRPGPLRLADVMKELTSSQGYSRFGAWKAVRRAVEMGSVRIERAGRQVWVRSVS